jgi:hypothetical protein
MHPLFSHKQPLEATRARDEKKNIEEKGEEEEERWRLWCDAGEKKKRKKRMKGGRPR